MITSQEYLNLKDQLEAIENNAKEAKAGPSKKKDEYLRLNYHMYHP